MKLNGFDRIAFAYDFLAKVVFGKTIIESQTYFLPEIKEQARVLILGGGSGWLLVELLRTKPNCEVWYIEASEKMIALSMQKNKHADGVHFIHGTELDIPGAIQFDAVITNFYLDLLTDDQLKGVVERIQSSLNARALWIATDFIDGHKLWQRMLLSIMYWFFRITCRIKTHQLPNWTQLLEQAGMREITSRTFYGDFIKTVKLQR